MSVPKFCKTWGGGEELFHYSGSVKTGTVVAYGDGCRFRATITAAQYAAILAQFSGKDLSIGTSIDKPPSGSVGEWVKANVNRSGLMSYIGAILMLEGYATKPKRGRIRFHHPV
jgi:hypothetical protein